MWQMRKIRLWEKAGWIIIRGRETARKLGLYMEKERVIAMGQDLHTGS